MKQMDMCNIIAEAAVALQEAKEEIQRLQDEVDDYKYIHKCAQDDLRDAERRIQFLESIL